VELCAAARLFLFAGVFATLGRTARESFAGVLWSRPGVFLSCLAALAKATAFRGRIARKLVPALLLITDGERRAAYKTESEDALHEACEAEDGGGGAWVLLRCFPSQEHPSLCLIQRERSDVDFVRVYRQSPSAWHWLWQALTRRRKSLDRVRQAPHVAHRADKERLLTTTL